MNSAVRITISIVAAIAITLFISLSIMAFVSQIQTIVEKRHTDAPQIYEDPYDAE